MSKLSIGSSQRQDLDEGSTTTRIDLKHPDGTESATYVQLNAMSGQFLPFRPPPAPRPESSSSSTATGALDAASESAIDDVDTDAGPSHRVYRAILTIEETTDADGQVKVVAHSPQLIEDQDQAAPQPRSFLERMALRQLRHEDVISRRRFGEEGGGDGMLAISVRRQKKLKMKKKKYKKLMRRTRNLRRKLDRN